MKKVAYMNWSGGKDSSLCLHYVLQQQRYDVRCLLTSVNAAHDRISMHGVRRSLLQLQAEAIWVAFAYHRAARTTGYGGI
jgi:Predicted ATPases of PP-loop superfamily